MKPQYLILLVLLSVSCHSQENRLLEINPLIFVNDKITLKEIADDIKYIKLDNSFPIGITYSIRITSGNIYLSIKDVGIVEFDLNGKMVCNIGHKGRGPEEYIYGMDFIVDEKNGRIYLLDPGKIKIYNHDGVFIRDISVKAYINGTAEGIEMFGSLLLIPDYNTYGNSKSSWIFLDTLGNLVSQKVNSIPSFSSGLVPPGCIYKFENNLFYFNYLNDTIFTISQDLKDRGAYLFAKGNFRWPRKDVIINSLDPLYTLFRPANMFETKSFIFLEYAYQDRWAILLIDKKSERKYQAYKVEGKNRSMVKTKACIINDLDGGLPLSTRPFIYYYKENETEYVTALINPYDLKAYISSNEFVNAVPKYPEKKRALEKLANSLKESDNPVLMTIRLKK